MAGSRALLLLQLLCGAVAELYAEALVEAVRAAGGRVDPRLRFRATAAGLESFVSADVAAGEQLLWLNESLAFPAPDLCGLVQLLEQQQKRLALEPAGADVLLAHARLTQARGDSLPAFWPSEVQQLAKALLGQELGNSLGDCELDLDLADETLEASAAAALRLATLVGLPLIDAIPVSFGPRCNVVIERDPAHSDVVVAATSRAVRARELLKIPYDHGTAVELFEQSGRLQGHPRRWACADGLQFVMDEDAEGSPFVASWSLRGQALAQVPSRAAASCGKQLQELRAAAAAAPATGEQSRQASGHARAVWQVHDAMVAALEMAQQSASHIGGLAPGFQAAVGDRVLRASGFRRPGASLAAVGDRGVVEALAEMEGAAEVSCRERAPKVGDMLLRSTWGLAAMPFVHQGFVVRPGHPAVVMNVDESSRRFRLLNFYAAASEYMPFDGWAHKNSTSCHMEVRTEDGRLEFMQPCAEFVVAKAEM